MERTNPYLSLYERCQLCPRCCGVDRLAGETGFCGAGATPKIARAALHYWEEPCLSGQAGSGAVFFSHCTLRCVYCQNADISARQQGQEVSEEELAQVFLHLQEQGALNINLVTPGHYLPSILWALELARAQGLCLPVVYNTSGYERVECLRLLRGKVQVYLPDCKYLSAETARRYSGVEDYFGVAVAALDEMVEQTGPPRLDERGVMTGGVIIRQLLLPGRVGEAQRLTATLHARYGDRVYLSLMNQYTPILPQVAPWPELCRTVTPDEYDQWVDHAVDCGVEKGFVQEGDTAEESFIPPFDGSGLPAFLRRG